MKTSLRRRAGIARKYNPAQHNVYVLASSVGMPLYDHYIGPPLQAGDSIRTEAGAEGTVLAIDGWQATIRVDSRITMLRNKVPPAEIRGDLVYKNGKCIGWHCPDHPDTSEPQTCDYERYGEDQCEHCRQPDERK